MRIRDYAKKFRRWVESGSNCDYDLDDGATLEELAECWICANYGNGSVATMLRQDKHMLIELMY